MNKYDPDYAKYQEWVDGVNRAYYHLLGSGDNFSDHIQDFLFFTAVGFFYWLLLLSGIWMILRGRFFIMLPGDTYPKPYFAYCIGGAYIICWMGNMAPFMSIYGYGLAQIFGYELVFEASEIAFYYGNAFMLFGVIDLSPKIKAITKMRFLLEFGSGDLINEETLHRRTNHQSHKIP